METTTVASMLVAVALPACVLTTGWAVRLALSSPRHCGTRTRSDFALHLLLALGDALLLPYYLMFPNTATELRYDASSSRNCRMVAKIPALKCYAATFWLRNAW